MSLRLAIEMLYVMNRLMTFSLQGSELPHIEYNFKHNHAIKLLTCNPDSG